ncbi:MAG: hypothetical protein AAB552_04055 [Patescibacteria group bacterium]
MQILTVTPLARGGPQGSLTYFSKDPAPVGSLVMVPLRSREVPALVLASNDASNAKASLKSSDYTVKKIARLRPRLIFTDAFIEAARETAQGSAQDFGETLFALTPKTILDAYVSEALEPIKKDDALKPDKKSKIRAIQTSTVLRGEAWKRLVRESFVRHESVFICLPTALDVERVAEELKHGIEDYTFAFHSNLTKKRLLADWKKATEEQHAIVVIGTPQYLMLPRAWSTVVIDEEHSRAWKTIAPPHLDMRITAEHYAQHLGATLIFGAPCLRPETHVRITSGEIYEFDRIDTHARKNDQGAQPLETAIIDPRPEEKQIKMDSNKRTVAVLTERIRQTIEQAVVNNERVFLLAVRKGLASVTACGDCGTLVRCKVCEAPLVIHKKTNRKDEPAGDQSPYVFSCHSCGNVRTPEAGLHETCTNCQSWRLEPLGIGIERIEEEIAKLFPDTPCFTLDGDHAKTRSQAKKIISQFEKACDAKKQGAILIGTPMAVPYLSTMEHTAIISLDSLFAIPDFRMSERIFALVLALREKTSASLLVQTRTDDTTLLVQALDGNLAEFMQNELALRKAFSYPPFGTIVKVTIRGSRATLPTELERLKEFLSDYAPIAPGICTREPKGLFRMHLILKLADTAWPNETLTKKLRALPRGFMVEVNPDHLL